MTSGYSQLSFRGLLFGPDIDRCVRRSVLDLVSRLACVRHVHGSHISYAVRLLFRNSDQRSKVFQGFIHGVLEFIDAYMRGMYGQ